MAATNAPRTARERVRVELTREILDVARRQLAEHGSAGLSLRAVARELGMVSSAVYRYFPSRDDLLTALIIDAYAAAGAAAEAAERAVDRERLMQRWVTTCVAVRRWAVGHPQEYALIFGSPVPGYRAPPDTVDPAARIPLILIGIVADAQAAGRTPASPVDVAMPAPLSADLGHLATELGQAAPAVPPHQLARALMAWTQLIGTVSFELFGHLHNVVHDYPAHFEYQMRVVGTDLGLN